MRTSKVVHEGWRREAGQALALSALAMGSVLLLVGLATTGAAFLLSGRVALSKGAAAGALAALAQTRTSLQLQVTYESYFCDDQGTCTPKPGHVDVAISDGAAFRAGEGMGFGPLPGWAVAAGCIGTTWPDGVHQAGTYRVCINQQAVGGSLTTPAPSAMRQEAERWLEANVQADGQLQDAHVTQVTVGPNGEVTVEAMANLRPAVLMFRSVRVSETAWPGAVS